jgi:four helix bundle protein
MNAHRELPVWQQAKQLVLVVYRLTSNLPADERWIATPQMRRAAWSVVNNIAEGNARLGRAERRRFFDTAIASLAEVDTMADVLGAIYPTAGETLREVEALRQRINRGLFVMLRTRPAR